MDEARLIKRREGDERRARLMASMEPGEERRLLAVKRQEVELRDADRLQMLLTSNLSLLGQSDLVFLLERGFIECGSVTVGGAFGKPKLVVRAEGNG